MKDVLIMGGQMTEAAMAASMNPPLRIINLDEAMRKYADTQQFPSSCIFTVDEVRQKDQAMAKAKARNSPLILPPLYSQQAELPPCRPKIGTV